MCTVVITIHKTISVTELNVNQKHNFNMISYHDRNEKIHHVSNTGLNNFTINRGLGNVWQSLLCLVKCKLST